MASGSKARLIVLYGGRSAEHEVSCVSALNFVAAIDRNRYDLQLIGITTDGRWVDTTSPALAAAAAGERALPSPDCVAGTAPPALLPAGPGTAAGGPGRPDQPAGGAEEATVVLPLLHGPMGEDGTVQGLLELAGLPYCGAGVAGSANAMDKGLAKALFSAAGLPQTPYLYRQESEFGAGMAAEVEKRLGWPVFVKPANMGSSIGITKVKDPGGLDAALSHATRYDTAVVIEAAVEGARELEIGVLGWPDLRTSVPAEIRPSHEFYDFEDKYVDGAAELVVPARIDEEVAGEMRRLAIAACRALRVDSMARVDFFHTEATGLLVNEVNTIPGLTPISMFPRMWAASGVPYTSLIDTLVDQARRRAARRRAFETGH